MSLVIGAVLTSLASGQMQDALREIPQHWWGLLALAPAVLGVLGLSATW